MILETVTQKIKSNWNEYFPNKSKPDSIDYLGISGSVEGGTTTFLAFGKKYNEALCALKIHRNPDSSQRIINEETTLYKLSKISEISSNVPTVWFSSHRPAYIVESIVAGKPMDVQLNHNEKPEVSHTNQNFGLVFDWQKKLALATVSHTHKSLQNLINHDDQLIRNYIQIFNLDVKEKSYLHFINSNLSSILAQGSVVYHGDFCRQNILINNNQISVIDWTDSKLESRILHDIFFFLTSYFIQSRKSTGIKSFIEAFKYSFFEENDYSQLIKNYVSRYLFEQKISSEFIPELFALFLINQSFFEYQKLVTYSSSGGFPRFTVHLCVANNSSYKDAFKEQLWIYFLKYFIENKNNFTLKHLNS